MHHPYDHDHSRAASHHDHAHSEPAAPERFDARGRPEAHGHIHGVTAHSIASSRRGIWAIKWSFLALLVTALLQASVVFFSGSVALLADTIHNVGDAATALGFATPRSRSPGVTHVTEVRARWVGHRLLAEVNIAVDPALSVGGGHSIATEVNHQLLHHLTYLSQTTIHVDPSEGAGEDHHHIRDHVHDGLPIHSH